MAKPANAPAGLGLAFRFALREMRAGLRGFFVFIACIALGVAAIAGVASVSRTMTEGISSEGQSILGADLSFSLIHRQANEGEWAFLKNQGTVSEVATLRAMARKPAEQKQALVELKAVDNLYPLYGTFELTSADDLHALLTPVSGKVWNGVADPSLLSQLDLSVGDTVDVGRITVKIADAIASEPDKLSDGMTIGPRILISQEALTASGLVQPGSLVNYHYRLKLPAGTSDDDLKQIIAQASEDQPNAGWRARSRVSAAPGLQRSIERFAQFLTLVGLTSLIVGGVGVANAVRSYLASKREVIASFKCLGASGNFVFQIYLFQILMLASIGIAIGLVIGALIPFLALGLLSGVLPVAASAGFYPSELLMGIVYGLLTALAFAIWPLGRAHDVPPSVLFRDEVSNRHRLPNWRYMIASGATVALLLGLAVVLAHDQRIALIYVSAAVGAYALLLLVARAIMWAAAKSPQVRSTEWRLAISNIHRPGALTPSVVLSLGLGLTLLVALALIDGNLRRELQQTASDEAPSFFFVDIQNTERDGFEAFVSEKAPNSTFSSVPMLRGRITALNDIPVAELPPPPDDGWVLRGDRGITYSATKPANSTIDEGEWWADDHNGEPLVSFDAEIAQNLGLNIGDKVTVNVLGRELSARIANLRTVDWQSMSINFVMVFSPNMFAGAPHTHLATVAWSQPTTMEQELGLLKEVTASFPTITSIRVKDAISQVNALVEQLAWAIRGASSITLFASMLVLGGALAAGHKSRIYDAVILKTLGATRKRLIYAYLIEYMLLGLSTAGFSLIAGSLAASYVISGIMGGTFQMLPSTAIAAVLGALLFTVGFGLLGTWRVLGEKPAPVLRNL
ncbi:ABC transporter permease [Rhodobacteraceae bacterium RKSG542]|uniref:ABC transporter permease n=1 Tax=Pseudovibrio flavus TaxID=2529854 RepID=UPI0012BCB0C0|nr:ABC transporter permease [Pseudovibrio flavus]MTI18281.1 ABC transporter permease [Pseudovibrio flavus]